MTILEQAGFQKPKPQILTPDLLREQVNKITEQIKPDFQEDFLYTYKLDSSYEELDKSIISKVMSIIWLENIMTSPKSGTSFSASDILKEIKWQWKTEGGTLVTRLAKWYREKFGNKLSDDSATAIGNLVALSLGKVTTYYVDFTRNLTWEAGDFADGGSCFWSCHKEARIQLGSDRRFYAMRLFRCIKKPRKGAKAKDITSLKVFYETDESYCVGVSRVWLGVGILPVPKSKIKDHKKTCYITFNGYGYNHDFFARLLAGIFGLDHKYIQLRNNDRTGGKLFINDNGYIVGPKSVIEPVDKYDFGMGVDQEWQQVERASRDKTYPDDYQGPGAYFRVGGSKSQSRVRMLGGRGAFNPEGYFNLERSSPEYQLIN